MLLFRQRYGLTKDNKLNLTYGFVVKPLIIYENNISYKKVVLLMLSMIRLDFDKEN